MVAKKTNHNKYKIWNPNITPIEKEYHGEVRSQVCKPLIDICHGQGAILSLQMELYLDISLVDFLVSQATHHPHTLDIGWNKEKVCFHFLFCSKF